MSPDLSARLDGLDTTGLLALRGLIDARLRDLGDATRSREEHTAPKQPAGGGAPTSRPKGRRWVELKIIRGCGPYAYERWLEGGRKRSRYIGKV